MKDFQAAEKIKKEYIEGHIKDTVDLKIVDLDVLKQMKKSLENMRYIEERLEFYDNESDNFENINWIDIEGEGYGWVWLNHPPRKWHSLMRKKALRFIRNMKETLNKDAVKRYVIVIKEEDSVIYHFIEREENECDTIYTFSNTFTDF